MNSSYCRLAQRRISDISVLTSDAMALARTAEFCLSLLHNAFSHLSLSLSLTLRCLYRTENERLMTFDAATLHACVYLSMSGHSHTAPGTARDGRGRNGK